jgi:hypothetical protein
MSLSDGSLSQVNNEDIPTSRSERPNKLWIPRATYRDVTGRTRKWFLHLGTSRRDEPVAALAIANSFTTGDATT